MPDVYKRKLMNENGEWETVAELASKYRKQGVPENRIQIWLCGLDVDFLARCAHKKTAAINEEGHAGIFCVDCGKQLEDGC